VGERQFCQLSALGIEERVDADNDCARTLCHHGGKDGLAAKGQKPCASP
jgi:hypothetical protein